MSPVNYSDSDSDSDAAIFIDLPCHSVLPQSRPLSRLWLTADLQVVRRLRAGYHSLQLCPTCRLLCTKMDQNPRRDLMRASSKVTKQLSLKKFWFQLKKSFGQPCVYLKECDSKYFSRRSL